MRAKQGTLITIAIPSPFPYSPLPGRAIHRADKIIQTISNQMKICEAKAISRVAAV
jgi:hypothetical protein